MTLGSVSVSLGLGPLPVKRAWPGVLGGLRGRSRSLRRPGWSCAPDVGTGSPESEALSGRSRGACAVLGPTPGAGRVPFMAVLPPRWPLLSVAGGWGEGSQWTLGPGHRPPLQTRSVLGAGARRLPGWAQPPALAAALGGTSACQVSGHTRPRLSHPPKSQQTRFSKRGSHRKAEMCKQSAGPSGSLQPG